MDNDITYVEVKSEEPKKNRIVSLVISLVFLTVSIALACIIAGLIFYDYPEYTEDMGGGAATGLLLMILANFMGTMVTFAFLFACSFVGFLCAVYSLKSLPNKAIKTIAKISMCLNGAFCAVSFIPAAIIIFGAAILLIMSIL